MARDGALMADEIPAPVYGPGRAYAAQQAIAELAAAKAEYEERCTGWSDYDDPRARARYHAAKANREQYHEYGASYDY